MDNQTEPQTLRAMAARLERVEALCERAANYSFQGYQLSRNRSAVAWLALATAVFAVLLVLIL